ncbi:Ribonuclease H-like domain containing protein [Parasponia andersonii]|uniref:Ribonuclease H-like domain containing protein n=1 Tax=Parasponia andersonii TaxID=3476 RepID=A0A2P5DB96_PARAD|nr:Ribonuclease H-like domain containing protein [Parasponia andersonii]
MVEVLKPDFEIWYVLTRMLWKERNNVLHLQSARSTICILEDVKLWLMDYKNINKVKEPPFRSVPPALNWEAPPLVQLKLNVDAVVNSTTGWIGMGAVIRDSKRTVCGALSTKIKGHPSAYVAECLALCAGLRFALSQGLFISTVESDSLKVISAVKKIEPLSFEGPIINDIIATLRMLGGMFATTLLVRGIMLPTN